ncbi:MAG TPA: DedA family protein [Candidatus Binataceae bacterium]|nr:DedA family protein [Candidatus Binataceae bacterium]
MALLVSHYIEHFTYAGLFLVLILCGLGLPVPEDVALLAGGFMVHRGITEFPITLAVSFVGVIAGDNTLFYVGRKFGSTVIAYLGLGRPKSQRQIERLKGFMARNGHMAIFYARFLAGVRALVYLTAGSLRVVSPARFFIYDSLGALISVPIVVSLGYLFGAQIESVIHYMGGFENIIFIVVILSLLFYGTRLLISASQEHDAGST